MMNKFNHRPQDRFAYMRFWSSATSREQICGVHPKYRNRRSAWTKARVDQYENAVKAFDAIPYIRQPLLPAKAQRRAQ